MDHTDNIPELQNAIRRLHGCESAHVESVTVTESFEGRTVWEGDVQVFQIHGHPKAQRAYAWSHLTGKDDQEKRYVAVLALPPITSPETAVKAAIMAEIRDAREKAKGGQAKASEG